MSNIKRQLEIEKAPLDESFEDIITRPLIKLKPIEKTDSPQVKALKHQWEVGEFIFNQIMK